jgi:hypothetical protein
MFEFQVLLPLLQQNDAEDLSEHLHELAIGHVFIIILLLLFLFDLGRRLKVFREVFGRSKLSDTVV